METRTIDGHEYHFTLGDDGTMDTVVEVFDVTTGKTETWRYNPEMAYRDFDGSLDFNAFIDDIVGPDASAHDWEDDYAGPDPQTGIGQSLSTIRLIPAVHWTTRLSRRTRPSVLCPDAVINQTPIYDARREYRQCIGYELLAARNHAWSPRHPCWACYRFIGQMASMRGSSTMRRSGWTLD